MVAALLVLAAVAAFLGVWQATRGGDGVTRDSVDYLASAESIIRGDGVTAAADHSHDLIDFVAYLSVSRIDVDERTKPRAGGEPASEEVLRH
jgi:hypothetical protein